MKKEYIDILEVELSNERSEVHKHEQIKNKQNQDIRTSDRLLNSRYTVHAAQKAPPGHSPEAGTAKQALFIRKMERRKGHMKDALALGGEEGRDKLR